MPADGRAMGGIEWGARMHRMPPHSWDQGPGSTEPCSPFASLLLSTTGMGRPRPLDSGLDRGVPKPSNKKKRRLSDGGAPAGGILNGGAAAAAVPKQKRPLSAAAGGSTLSCPAAVTRALARAVDSQQRTLCVLLSDAPDAGTILFRMGWDATHSIQFAVSRAGSDDADPTTTQTPPPPPPPHTTALAELVRGWKGSGGKGKCCVVVADGRQDAAARYPLLRQQQPQARYVFRQIV